MKRVITQYKVGRNVKFYDVQDLISNEVFEKVEKKELEKMVTEHPDDFEEVNFQEFKGQKILRIKSKTKVVAINPDGTETTVSEAEAEKEKSTRPVKKSSAVDFKSHIDAIPSSKIVGRIPKKQKQVDLVDALSKENGYTMKNILEQRELRASVSLDGLATYRDLFVMMAKEFGLVDIESHIQKISVKQSTVFSTPLKGQTNVQIARYQQFYATYLMNVVHDQVNKAYSKYTVELMQA